MGGPCAVNPFGFPIGDPKLTEAKTISLVLGSGGARGLAHIGVIRVLERHGWQIGAISGSSMGALIGAFYAAGRLDDYADWVQELSEFNVLRYLDIAWGGAGMLKGEMLMVNLSSRTRGLLATLGLDQLIRPFIELLKSLSSRPRVLRIRFELIAT